MKDIIWIACGLINIGIGILHIYIAFKGAKALRYYGAGEWMATKAEQGSWFPAFVTILIAFVFFAFAAYCFAGADSLWIDLPLLAYGLIGIAAIYLLRGSVAIAFPFSKQTFSRFEKVSTYIALIIGLLHSAGAYLHVTENKF